MNQTLQESIRQLSNEKEGDNASIRSDIYVHQYRQREFQSFYPRLRTFLTVFQWVDSSTSGGATLLAGLV